MFSISVKVPNAKKNRIFNVKSNKKRYLENENTITVNKQAPVTEITKKITEKIWETVNLNDNSTLNLISVSHRIINAKKQTKEQINELLAEYLTERILQMRLIS